MNLMVVRRFRRVGRGRMRSGRWRVRKLLRCCRCLRMWSKRLFFFFFFFLLKGFVCKKGFLFFFPLSRWKPAFFLFRSFFVSLHLRTYTSLSPSFPPFSAYDRKHILIPTLNNNNKKTHTQRTRT